MVIFFLITKKTRGDCHGTIKTVTVGNILGNPSTQLKDN